VIKIEAETDTEPPRAAVWNVEGALRAGQSTEELLGAVEAILSVFKQRAEVSFHPPTQLLIARGTDEQLDLVREAVEELTSRAEQRYEELEDIREDIEALEEQVHAMAAEMRMAEQEHKVAQTRLARMMKQHELNNVTLEEVSETELEVTRTETHLKIVADRQERAKRRLERFTKRLQELSQPHERE
jgi:chromosome segregation ATPase